MRSLYLPGELTRGIGDLLQVNATDAHHLIRVCRMRLGDEVLINYGDGLGLVAKLVEATPRSCTLKLDQEYQFSRGPKLEALVAITKRDSMEDVIRQSVELGLERILFFRADYSQKLGLKEQRVPSLLRPAIEQSNNGYPPDIRFLDSLELALEQAKYPLFLAQERPSEGALGGLNGPGSILIGPEGGWSDAENVLFGRIDHLSCVHFPGPIMRTPTALARMVGAFGPQ